MIRFLTAGESHGQALVGIIEGVPAGLAIDAAYINRQLARRQQGYGRGGRMKIEKDEVTILTGIRYGKTLGSPIALTIENRDWKNWTGIMAVEGERPESVEKIGIVRPGHADYSASVKYRYDDVRNSIERASARETAMRVALCTIARRFLEEVGIYIGSHVVRIGSAAYDSRNELDGKIAAWIESENGAYRVSEEADRSEVRMLDGLIGDAAIEEIKKAKKEGDTLGGVFEVIATGAPAGLGSHVHYDRKIEAQFAQAILSIPAVKAVEIGDGVRNAGRPGSQVHDEVYPGADGGVYRRTNRAGGTEGGITNGDAVVVRGFMKPIATLMRPLKTVDMFTGVVADARRERSDFCAVPACSVIGEAVVAPVLANAFLEKFGGDSMQEIAERYGIPKIPEKSVPTGVAK
jgi:chorismate synthase